MRYLFDTHIVLWALANSKRLPSKVKNIIKDSDNEIYYSTASSWEIEIKHQKKENFDLSGEQFIYLCDLNGLINIDIKNDHVKQLKNINKTIDIKHNDPFDKILLCQSINEDMIFVTHDRKFEAYSNKNIMLV